MVETTDPSDPRLTHGIDSGGPVSQAEAYLVLPKAERAKGFIRPVRQTYLHLVCGATTTMARGIAETYSRNPNFYRATYCVRCQQHCGVGADGEFVWIENDGTEGPKVGT